jgi:hypothetical protein
MWYESDYGAETADYDPREDAEPQPEPEPEVPADEGSWWDQALGGRFIRPATLLAAYPHF